MTGATSSVDKLPDWVFLGVRIRQLSTPGDPLIVAEAWLPEGASPPLHVHDDLDDSFYLLEGTMVVRCGDEVTLARSGSWVPFPHGVPHTFRVLDGPAKAVLVHNNDTFLRLARTVGHSWRAGEGPAPAGPGADELSRAMARCGIRNVGDPMEPPEAEQWRQRLTGTGSPV